MRKFNTAAERDEYLSLRDACDGDWRRFVQRRRDGVATEAEYRLADEYLLDRLKKPRKKARDAEARNVLVYLVLLEMERQRRSGHTQQGVQEEAVRRVIEKFHVGRTAVFTALSALKKGGTSWQEMQDLIGRQLDLIDRAMKDPESINIDTDSSLMLVDRLTRTPK
jgi:hypothetical protein